MGRPRVGESELGRQTIVEKSLELLDAHGLEALSLARIASALRVQTPALYWHFASKAELYTYMVEIMFGDVIRAVDPSLTGRELLWAFGHAKLANLRRRRDAAKLISIAGVSDEIRKVMVPALLARIVGPDMTPVQARQMLTAVQALAVGWAVFESNPATNEVMRYSNEGDHGYEEALRHLVFGKTPHKADLAVP